MEVKGPKLGTVIRFKYLGAFVSDDEDSLKDCTRLSHLSIYKLKPIWRDNNIPLGSKEKLTRSLISMFLCACDSLAELEKRTQASEMRFYQRLLTHVICEEVHRKSLVAIEEYDELTLVKKQKLRWFGLRV